MKIAVLFDGAGLARLGLEQAGHTCTGYELDPAKHHLSQFVGSGHCTLADATSIDLSSYDGIWASPPCQFQSVARTQGTPVSAYAHDLLPWSLSLPARYPGKVVWIENVLPQTFLPIWGKPYNAAQFQAKAMQNRPRIIAGAYPPPMVYREFQRQYNRLNLCPTVTATEYKGCATDKRRASRYYGRRLTLEECASLQGLTIPDEWYTMPEWYRARPGQSHKTGWLYNLYEAIGNGVPVYMAYAFGLACVGQVGMAQMKLFA